MTVVASLLVGSLCTRRYPVTLRVTRPTKLAPGNLGHGAPFRVTKPVELRAGCVCMTSRKEEVVSEQVRLVKMIKVQYGLVDSAGSDFRFSRGLCEEEAELSWPSIRAHGRSISTGSPASRVR